MEENVKLDKNNRKDIEMMTVPPRPNELQFAEKLVLLTAMPETVAAHKEKKLDSLIPKYDGKIIVTTGEKSMSSLLGKSALFVLMSTIRIRAVHLYMTRAHCGEGDLVHRSAVETLARSRADVWIVKGKQFAKKIVLNCNKCIIARKLLITQQISELKPENLSVCKPWSYVSLDFCGPITIKGVVNKHARLK